jgi:hypothetical protein
MEGAIITAITRILIRIYRILNGGIITAATMVFIKKSRITPTITKTINI